MMNIYHTSILGETIIEYLNIQPDSVIADLTTGEGGHSSLIAPHLCKGTLLCVDRDKQILSKAQERLKVFDNIVYVCDTFDRISEIRTENKLPLFNGVLVDMGISMFHFKGAGRGFSFEDDKLDMRLSFDDELTAQDVINTFSANDLADIFYYYGEEYHSRRIASSIVKQRPFFSAKELSDYMLKICGRKGKTHPATKIFQGLRIFVNKELEIAENFFKSITDNLASSGILCVLTFHSLEDRLVKRAFKEYKQNNLGVVLTEKPITPSDTEIKTNPAARSAKLRIFQRI
ncbi:MAG: 16S rRNA (cytosine(1402)-N(4))-methyltransferase RsmH [Brevinemataceae bacterium]